jgi:hypothetical protein
MIGRVFWFTVGAGAAVFVAVKVRGYLQQATPQAIGHRVTESATGITDSVRDFSDRVRAAMAEREAELRDTLGLND